MRTESTARLNALREWELHELQGLYRAVDRFIADLTEMIPCLEAAEGQAATTDLEVGK